MSPRLKSWIGIALAGVLALAAGVYLGAQGMRPQDAGPLLALSLPDGTGKPVQFPNNYDIAFAGIVEQLH